MNSRVRRIGVLTSGGDCPGLNAVIRAITMDAVAKDVADRARRGKHFLILCVAEGARPAGGEQVVARHDATSPDPVRFGGISRVVADALEAATGIESRSVVLGHVQRGGPPIPADRVLATQFGWRAMNLLMAGATNRMVAMRGLTLTEIPVADAAGKQRTIPPDHALLAAARAIGTSFGDP